MSKSTISFLVFIILVVVIFIGSSVFANLGKSDGPAVVNPVNTVSSSSTPVSGTGVATSPAPAVTGAVKTGTTTNTPAGITMVDVQKHNSANSCWTAVNGGVYDLTSFTAKHPGGANAILSLCGIDGTSAFMDQHGNQRRPNNELTGLKIGDLAK